MRTAVKIYQGTALINCPFPDFVNDGQWTKSRNRNESSFSSFRLEIWQGQGVLLSISVTLFHNWKETPLYSNKFFLCVPQGVPPFSFLSVSQNTLSVAHSACWIIFILLFLLPILSSWIVYCFNCLCPPWDITECAQHSMVREGLI